jgi:hypothetical protein
MDILRCWPDFILKIFSHPYRILSYQINLIVFDLHIVRTLKVENLEYYGKIKLNDISYVI